MKKIGVIKEIDSLGRLQIPKEIRNRLELGKRVELILTHDGLIVRSEEYRLVKISKQDKNDDREKNL